MSRKITLEELEEHGGKNGSYWTAINGKVYDISQFVDKHPGGSKIIKLAAGRYVFCHVVLMHLCVSRSFISVASQGRLSLLFCEVLEMAVYLECFIFFSVLRVESIRKICGFFFHVSCIVNGWRLSLCLFLLVWLLAHKILL